MKLPNFFIVGAPKCGTTSLASWLKGHPNIYMPPLKEPFYFSTDVTTEGVHSWPAYSGLFEAALQGQSARGEASTTYLYSRVAIPDIEKRLPGSRYVVMVRNPVDMAPALHEEHIRVFHEDVTDFKKAWQLSGERRKGRARPANCPDARLLDYQHWCMLGDQLARLYGLVDSKRVLVIVLDDLRESADREYRRVLAFLDVPDDHREVFPTLNKASHWRSKAAGRVLRHLSLAAAWAKDSARILPRRKFGLVRRAVRLVSQERPRARPSVDVQIEMQSYFEQDIAALENLLGRQFPHWRLSL